VGFIVSTPASEVLVSGAQDAREAPPQSELNMRVCAEQIRHIYNQTPTFVPAVFVGAVFTIAMLWPATSPVVAITWCAWIWFVYAIFWEMCRRWKKARPDDAAMQAWARPFIVMAWVATASWGMAGVLFFHPESFVYQSLLLISLAMGSAAITATSTAYSPTFYPVVMMLLPLSLRLLYEGGVIYQILAAAMWVFTAMLFFLHRNSHLAFASNLQLRFHNEALAKQLTVQKNLAEQANIAKSKFLAAASHDLRQPLHALGLFLGELHERIEDPDARSRLMSRMYLSVESMTDLFNALLDISRFDAGMIKPEWRSFYANEVLEDLRREYALRAQDKGLSFRCMPCSVVIRSDPLLLRRMLRNLIENAIRYTKSGGILLGCRRGEGFVDFQVWDTGIGIAEHNLEEIFKEFHQLHNPERDRQKGLGLGLSVVQQLAGILGHELSVRSDPGKGSLFSVRIPLGTSGDADSLQKAEDLLPSDRLESACILVIDDEAAIREGMRGLLEAWGCNVLEASSVEQALVEIKASQKDPEIIICDYRLRNNTSGIEAIQTIRSASNASLPAVLVSGDTSEESIQAARQADIRLLNKPLSPARLSTLLRFLLTGAGVGQQS